MNWCRVPIVIDASALAEVVAATPRAAGVEATFRGEALIAPDLINLEVLSVLRSWLTTNAIAAEVARSSVANLAKAPVRRFATAPLIAEVWSLRDNLTPYDACYVTLARRTGSPLLTLDHRLAGAPRLGIQILQPRP